MRSSPRVCALRTQVGSPITSQLGVTVALMPGRVFVMGENIFLFVPNIIGYFRILLALLSFYVMLTHPWLTCCMYLLNVLLDEFDGIAAQRLKQCTMFGAVLDMMTDRCAGIGLLVVLGHFYPAYLFLFQFLIALDISSHWVQMYSSLQQGDSSHKVTDLSANAVMRFYYAPCVLSVFCIGNEVFFVSLYMLHFMSDLSVIWKAWGLVAVATFPIAALKHIIHGVQLILACQQLGKLDTIKRLEKVK